MSRFSKRTFELSSKKRALLEALLQEEGVASSPTEKIPRRKDADSYPLSFAQQRLWFLDQFEPDSSFYNTPAAVRLTGQLNLPSLRQSLNEIVRRHEALRTTFISVDGGPQQVITPTLSVTLQLLDLRELSENERETEARRLISEEARRPFDLEQELLFRATLCRLAENENVLFINMHHIVSDGWSFGVLFRELTALYQAFSKGDPSPLPELPIQYADYAAWQRDWLRGEALEKQLSYWRQQLSGELPILELPVDRPRPAVQTFRGGERQFVILPKSLSEALEALSRQEGGTLFMTMLAAFKTLLSRYTNQEDIIVGSPIANRNRAEIEGLIGFFVNTLVLRTELSGDPTFRELLGRVRETTLGAYEHQDVPFEKLVEELRPERDLSHAPLFQVMFALQNAPGKALELEGLTLHPLRIDHGTSKFDLTLFMWTEGEGLRATVEYSTDLFDASTIKRMLGHFRVLLDAVVANPDQRLSELPLLTAAERRQLLVEWNSTQAEYPADKTVQEMFEQQVERTPEAVAVIFEDEQLTYAELNSRANQLAHFLRGLGIGPQARIGISIERSLEMVVGLLGILKAGSAYVPLDPTYPKERLAFMVGDAKTPVLLTQERLVESLPASQARLVRLDTDWKAIARQSKENPESSVRAENPAYVIYTSGSTGKPKGVTMTHSSLANLLSWQRQNSLGNGARTLQFASLSFDVSFQEIFSTWCTGGTLVLIQEELRRDAVSLLRFLTDQAVERLFLPFVALQQLSEVSDEEAVPGSLREVITAGEQLQVTRQMVNLFSRLPGCRLENQYGPSESHVVTSFALTGSPTSWPSLPPIGRPIANTQIYVVDRNLNPVPIGVPGELYIGGAGLARGYLNCPEATAERFVNNPFSAEAGDRLYKTGDVARYLPDSNIEFLGRIDHQVKVRGYRIELGEIETVLASHPAVREAVVIAWEDKPGDKRLVAYVLFKEQEAASVSEMRSYLKQKLPDYMAPATFVVLDALPLTPSGKVDRRALPAPDQARPELEGTYVAPRNSVEEVVAGIWAEVLKLERVGIHDNFFELGGHSLLATRVISRVRAGLRVELPLRSLFESPTVAELSHGLITSEAKLGQTQKIAKALQKIKSMSPEALRETLEQKSKTGDHA